MRWVNVKRSMSGKPCENSQEEVAVHLMLLQVYVRWVTDSEKYNEWMNPVDYETEESVEVHERKVGPSHVTKASFTMITCYLT